MNFANQPVDGDLNMLAPVIDVDSTMRRLANDVDLYQQIIQIFLEDAPNLLDSARSSHAARDGVALRRAAHSLKGLAGTVGAQRAESAAFQLEQQAIAGDLEEISKSLSELQQQLEETMGVLRRYTDRLAKRSRLT